LIPDKDIAFLASLGDTLIGYVARGEYAEMANIAVADLDRLALQAIYGEHQIESN